MFSGIVPVVLKAVKIRYFIELRSPRLHALQLNWVDGVAFVFLTWLLLLGRCAIRVFVEFDWTKSWAANTALAFVGILLKAVVRWLHWVIVDLSELIVYEVAHVGVLWSVHFVIGQFSHWRHILKTKYNYKTQSQTNCIF